MTLWDPDPHHLWNRLYAVLFVGSRLRMDGVDSFHDPMCNPPRGPSRAAAVAILDKFINTQGENLITDPLKRAVFQSDLWAVFDRAASGLYGRQSAALLPARLAPIIGRLELSDRQIRHLPDNYAAAVASGKYPASFNPAAPDEPFLPADLFKSNGPWVNLGAEDSPDGPVAPVAPAHLRFVSGRSLFLVLMHLPGGRQATLDYVKRLNNFPKPMILNPAYRVGPRHDPDPVRLNPDLPQFPAGTEFALVRRMMLIDDHRQLVASPLTQSVQIRVYRQIAQGGGPSHPQAFFEFQFTRLDLFQAAPLGLLPANKNQPDVAPIQEACIACHRAAGIFSVNSYTGAFGGHRPRRLTTSDNKDEAQLAADWKRQRYDWGLLMGLMQTQCDTVPSHARSKSPGEGR